MRKLLNFKKLKIGTNFEIVSFKSYIPKLFKKTAS